MYMSTHICIYICIYIYVCILINILIFNIKILNINKRLDKLGDNQVIKQSKFIINILKII